jgi:AAA15 family ATPase/GTPase
MLTSIHIQNFKGFKDTKIDTLKRVNLVVGGQNVGKTSLLEGIYVGYSLREDPRPQEEDVKSMIESLNNCKLRKSAGIRQQKWAATNGQSLDAMRFVLDGFFKRLGGLSAFGVQPVEEAELVRLYDIAVHSKTKKKWIELMQSIEPRLESLESVAAEKEDQPSVHAEIDSIASLIPLSQLGQGFNRLAYLYAGLLGQNANIALIDEIEDGIHYTALPILWQGVAHIANKLEIQIFATTHSKECIRAANDAFKDSPDDFQVIRLVRRNDNIEADIIPADYVQASLEMRGEMR